MTSRRWPSSSNPLARQARPSGKTGAGILSRLTEISRMFIWHFFSLDPSDDVHLSAAKDEIGHQEMEEVMFRAAEKPFKNRPRGADIFLRPEIPFLKLLNRHSLRFKDDMAHVIMGPVIIKNPSCFLQPFLEEG